MMKKYTLACLALFIAPAALAEPGLEETLAYIKARCDGFSYSSSGGNIYTTRSVSLDNRQLTYTLENHFGSETEGYRYHKTSTGKLDLRKVEISYIPRETGQGQVIPPRTQLRCGDNCIAKHTREESTYSDGTTETESSDDMLPVTSLFCRDADRVTRAFKHLQTLVGGAIKDPFAN